MPSDVLLGHAEGKPVHLLHSHRTAHVAILGKSRFGKTTLLEQLVLADMKDGTSAVIIDAHGDLSNRLISLADEQSREGISLIEPNSDRPFGLNLYECPDPANSEVVTRTVGYVIDIFNKLMGQESTAYRPLIDSGLRNSARALIANGCTMAELPLLYKDAAFRRAALRALPTPSDYWDEYERSDPRRQQEKREPVLNKVARFLEDDLIAPMVSQTKTTIPIQQVLDNGGILLLNLSRVDRDTVSFLGMVFLSVLSNLIEQRSHIPKQQRRRVHLYLDEYGRFATPTTQRMIHDLGKHELGVTLAHQHLSQTPEHEALKVETLIAFQLSGEDARLVAQQLDVTPVRFKTRLQQRTEPEYREWDEEVWVSTTAQRRYEDLRHEAADAEKTAKRAARTLYLLDKALNNESHCLSQIEPLKRWDYTGSFPVEELCAGTCEVPNDDSTPLDWHQAFNPAGAYFESMAEAPGRSTESGLIWYNYVFEAYHLSPASCHFTWLRWVLRLAPEALPEDKELLQPFIDEVPCVLAGPYAATDFCFIATDLYKGPAHHILGAERSRTGSYRNWAVQGEWRIARFPAAVRWLADRIVTLHADQVRAKTLQDESQRLYNRDCINRHRKDYIGERPITHEVWESGRGYVTQPLYDLIEESAQSPADRAGEIANTLTQLPRYVAYCKVVDPSGAPREHKIDTLPPAQSAQDNIFARALRINKKVKGAEGFNIDKYGVWTAERGYTFKIQQFQEDFSALMKQAKASGRSGDVVDEARIAEVRMRSREQYGTPADWIPEKTLMRRYLVLPVMRYQPPGLISPPPIDAGRESRPPRQPPHSPDKSPQPPTRPPSIGRRSPKKEQ
ncbi:type IV secretory system conjugative DNA transfer family protein [Streptomyces sp. CG4]|uniref:type IV secretory system conjugative DNA transfer family protein n=1 Tax=Streptomyces sp. CG4 TaxID=408783 RepID=UPI0034E24E85